MRPWSFGLGAVDSAAEGVAGRKAPGSLAEAVDLNVEEVITK
jgi:hypothetical protein